MIIGCGGAGKSTLARALSARTGLPVVHLDSEFWKPGWVESTREEFDVKHDASIRGERWIVDGNYSRTIDRRVAAADTIVVLDLPRIVCMYGILSRWFVNRGRSRPDMAIGCPEKIDWTFVKWVWSFRQRSRPKQMALVESLRSSRSVHVLRTRREVRRWLSEVPETNEGFRR
jgi:adenylate kinase family enzyme